VRVELTVAELGMPPHHILNGTICCGTSREMPILNTMTTAKWSEAERRAERMMVEQAETVADPKNLPATTPLNWRPIALVLYAIAHETGQPVASITHGQIRDRLGPDRHAPGQFTAWLPEALRTAGHSIPDQPDEDGAGFRGWAGWHRDELLDPDPVISAWLAASARYHDSVPDAEGHELWFVADDLVAHWHQLRTLTDADSHPRRVAF
jgi:hypothetical protein